MNTLLVCLSLALGEFAASFAPQACGAWIVALLSAVGVALFGYALDMRWWNCAAAFLMGVALFFAASVEGERTYREEPWRRGRTVRVERRSAFPAVARDLSRRLAIGLDETRDAVQLNRAILLGERRRMPKQMKRIFVESGTLHVFAISGLHVMAVAGLITLLLRVLFVPLRWVGVAAVPLLWGYVALIGFPPSAVRAGTMASLYLFAPAFWRRPDALRAWEVTFFAIYVGRPTMITDVGCALSFTVVLAIILAGRFARRFRSRILAALFVTFAAWAAGVPIAAHMFGRVSPGAMLGNLLLVPLTGVTVVAGLVGLAFSFVSTTLAAHFNALAALFTDSMASIAEMVAVTPGSNFEVERWTVFQCVEWYAVILLALVLGNSIGRRKLFR